MPRGATRVSPVIPIGSTTGKLIAPAEVFRKVENFVATEEGSFITGRAPLPFHPKPSTGGAPDFSSGSASATTSVYGDTKGISHCRVNGGQREILLLHTDDQVWEYRGWLQRWTCLLGPSSVSPLLSASLPKGEPQKFPTQFVTTPTGVVIVPQGGRAYFYDGRCIDALGYDTVPPSPDALGPESSSETYQGTYDNSPGAPLPHYHGVNDIGYAVDGLLGRFSAMNPVFKYGRIGTVQTAGEVSTATNASDSVQVMGYLLPGRFRTRMRWIDRWGNLSPASGPSDDINFLRQPATGGKSDGATGWESYWVVVDRVLKQVCWTNIAPGPGATIGRILYRTRDLVNSGTAGYYELPLNSAVVEGAFATLPDNETDLYPDNIPDGWLGAELQETVPVPQFRLAAMAFGRLWIANWPGGEGAMRPSMIGRWGTFEADRDLWPDPTGAEITGLHAVEGGLLALTETSTFLVTPSDDGESFQFRTVSSTTGCVAPSSIKTMRNGMTVWMGRDGFYGYSGGSVTYLWEELRSEARKLVRGRLSLAVAVYDPKSGEYMCWAASEGAADNYTCYRFDGSRWTWWRNVHAAHGACVTQDEKSRVLTCGVYSGRDGVWVDNASSTALNATLESGWLRSTSDTRASIRRVRLWLRETGRVASGIADLSIGIRRDWRAEFVSEATVRRFPDQESSRAADPAQPSFMDNSETWGTAAWRIRRPFWAKVDVEVPACEVFQVFVASVGRRYEILGIQFEESDRGNDGRDF